MNSKETEPNDSSRRGDSVVGRGNEEVQLLANSEVAIARYLRVDSSSSKGSRS